MNWNALYLLKNKLIVSALVAINLLPFLVSLLKNTGFDTWPLKTAIIGGMIFIIYYLTVESRCPDLIKAHKNKQAYKDSCLELNVNPYTEFEAIKSSGKDFIINALGEKDHLYPPEKGIYFSRNDTIVEYSFINYRFFNESRTVLRFFLSTLLLISFLAINTPLVIRVIHSLR